MRNFMIFGFMLLNLLSCAQLPPDLPATKAPGLDGKLRQLLSFSVPLIGVDSLRQLEGPVYLLDAREPEEYRVSHLPGARLVGYKEFQADQIADLPRDAPVVVYCSVGYRSEKIGEQLQSAGFSKVYNLYGSIFEWANNGYPLVNEQGDTVSQVHTYNRNWSQWVVHPSIEKTW